MKAVAIVIALNDSAGSIKMKGLISATVPTKDVPMIMPRAKALILTLDRQ